MRELRRLLGVLRHGEDAPPGDPAPTPQPGLGQLDRLIGQVRQAGLPVELGSPAARSSCLTGSTCPPTASCRRRSPTCSSTRGPPTLKYACAATAAASR